jgi:hypothetical protein
MKRREFITLLAGGCVAQDVTIDWDTVDQASLRLFRKVRSAMSLQSMIDARNC